MDEQLKKKLLARLADGRASGFPDPGPCWEWQMARTPSGYGQWTVRGLTTSRAHRIVWELLRGPIPDGLVIDHLCRNRACCNPDHLRVVTLRVNALENSEGISAKMAAREDCRYGHGPLRPHKYVEGKRHCHECARLAARDYQRRRAEAGDDRSPSVPPQDWCKKKAHRLLDENGDPTRDLLVRSDGRRECRGCHRERERVRRMRLREAGDLRSA